MKSILVADHDDSLVRYLEERFGDEVEIHWAQNGDEALATVNDSRPSVLILNLLLSGEHGFNVLRKIRMGQADTSTTIVAISDKPYPLDLGTATQLGADLALHRNGNAAQLYQEIGSFLETDNSKPA